MYVVNNDIFCGCVMFAAGVLESGVVPNPKLEVAAGVVEPNAEVVDGVEPNPNVVVVGAGVAVPNVVVVLGLDAVGNPNEGAVVAEVLPNENPLIVHFQAWQKCVKFGTCGHYLAGNK